MKNKCINLLSKLFILLYPCLMFAQSNSHEFTNSKDKVPVIYFQKPNLELIKKEDDLRAKNGQFHRIGVGVEVNITPQNNGSWTINENEDKIWRLKIKFPDAEALSFIFSKFYLFDKSYINVFNTKGDKVHLTYTKEDVLDHGQQNLSLCEGDELMLELVEPKGSRSSVLEMSDVFYAYRSTGFNKNSEKGFRTSGPCQVNVNCSEGNDWQDEKRGIARILLIVGAYQGWCTGSLVNNVKKDCKPYFLTAMHCGTGASASNLNNWRFYFNYESVGCTTPQFESSIATNYITGCVKIAGSEDYNESTYAITHSDFYLVHLRSLANESATIATLKSFQAYWNGWDANNTVVSNGVSIHHPDGDIKKISKFSSALISDSYSDVNSGTHWRAYWVATTNGHGTTEGGSSGSPLFNFNGGNSRIIGTLSGGEASCDYLNGMDLYGKMSYHWTSVGNTSNLQLKPWLDPDNTGIKIIDGSSDPCSTVGIDEISSEDIEVYPNPTNDVINVELKSTFHFENAVVFDVLGKKVDVEIEEQNGNLKLDLSSISNGIYQLIIYTNKGIIVKSVIKK